MQYLGGKHYLAKHLIDHMAPALQGASHYYEPFVGGGSMAAAVARRYPHLELHLSDLQPDLILLWQAVQDGWVPPTVLSEDQYKALRAAEPSALRGFAGFGCSYSGKWFGGYAHNNWKNRYAEQASNALVRKMRALQAATFTRHGYDQLLPEPGAVVYCDPPYEGTTEYAGVPPFDHEAFWVWAEGMTALGVRVYVSSYQARPGWLVAHEKAHRVDLRGADKTRAHTVERLYTHPC